MLQRKFQIWKILVAFAFVPVLIVQIFPMPQFYAETFFSVGLMFAVLVFVHGMQIIYLIMKELKNPKNQDAIHDKLYKALECLEDLERGSHE